MPIVNQRFGPQTEAIETIIAQALSLNMVGADALSYGRDEPWQEAWSACISVVNLNDPNGYYLWSGLWDAALTEASGLHLLVPPLSRWRLTQVVFPVATAVYFSDRIGSLFTHEHYRILTETWVSCMGAISFQPVLQAVETCGTCGYRLAPFFGVVALTRNDGSIVCSRCSWQCERCNSCFSAQEGPAMLVGRQAWCLPCSTQYARRCCCCMLSSSIEGQLSETDRPRTQGEGSVCLLCISEYYLSHTDILEHIPVTSYVRSGAECEICGVIVAPVVIPKRCLCGNGTLERPVHAYSCKPKLIFRGKSKHKIHMGFELETKIRRGDDSQEIHDAALFAMQALQIPDIAQLKYDSSIGGGFEIVTQPHTFEKYRDDSSILWETIDTLRKVHGARSWDAKTCGLHIHVSRNAFSSGRHTPQLHRVHLSQPRDA